MKTKDSDSDTLLRKNRRFREGTATKFKKTNRLQLDENKDSQTIHSPQKIHGLATAITKLKTEKLV